jgi:Protein of unknown function (DUF2946)
VVAFPFLRQTLAWIVCCAIVLGAVGASVAGLRSGNPLMAWGDLCVTAAPAGAGASASLAGDLDPQAPADHAGAHCPLCSLHVGDLALPTPEARGLLASGLAFLVPTLFLAAPRTLFAWAAAQPRGPPMIS